LSERGSSLLRAGAVPIDGKASRVGHTDSLNAAVAGIDYLAVGEKADAVMIAVETGWRASAVAVAVVTADLAAVAVDAALAVS